MLYQRVSVDVFVYCELFAQKKKLAIAVTMNFFGFKCLVVDVLIVKNATLLCSFVLTKRVYYV